MYNYWGSLNSGKAHIKMIFESSNKRTLMMVDSGSKTELYDNGYKYVYYYEDDTIKKVRRTKKMTVDKVKGYSTEVDKMDIFDSKVVRPPSWDDVINEWKDVALVLNAFPLLGLPTIGGRVDYNSSLLSTTDIGLDFIRSRKNIVPCKKDRVDDIRGKLACFNCEYQSKKSMRITGRPIRFKNILDAYNKHKEILWIHLDDILNEQKAIEYRLQQLEIPFDYFNLDTDSYDIFECTLDLPRDYTKWKGDDYIMDIAQEYVNMRNLK